MTTSELLSKINILLERKEIFKICRQKRKMYSDECYKGNIDAGHMTKLNLLDKAQKICDSEIKALKTVITVKEKQMKEIKRKIKQL